MPSKARVLCIDPAKVHLAWPSVSGFLDKAISRYGDWTPEKLRFEVFSGRMLLWAAADDEDILGAIVTSLNEDRRGRLVCHLVVCGGTDMKSWFQTAHDTIERFAREEGCSFVRMEGRPGWAAMLTDFKQPYIVLEKRLD
jgi:hypothetical protein